MTVTPTADPADIVRLQNLVHQFFRAWDRREVETVAAMMADDGVWRRAGKLKIGPEGVREAMAERKQGTTTAHIVNNLVVQALDADRLEASCYLTTYNEPSPADGSVTPVAPPRSIVIYEYVFGRHGDGWRILEIRNTPVFRRSA